MKHLPEAEYSFGWLQDKASTKPPKGLEPCTRLRRVVYIYEYAREYLTRLREKQAEIFGADQRDNSQLLSSALSELEKGATPLASVAHSLEVFLSQAADVQGQPINEPTNADETESPSGIEFVATPFQSLEASRQIEIVEEFGEEIETLLTGSSFLCNRAFFLKPWNPETVKEHPQLRRMFIQRWKEFRRDFFSPEEPGEMWLIAKFDMNETPKQRRQRFQDFEKRAESALSKLSAEERNRIKARSKTGRGEGAGIYVQRLTSLGAFRAIQHYGDWERAFAHTQSTDLKIRRRTPLLSHEARKWMGAMETVSSTIRDLYGSDFQ